MANMWALHKMLWMFIYEKRKKNLRTDWIAKESQLLTSTQLFAVSECSLTAGNFWALARNNNLLLNFLRKWLVNFLNKDQRRAYTL